MNNGTNTKRRRFKFGVSTRRNLKGLLFIAPWFAGFCAFFAYPLAQSAIYAAHKVTLTAKGRKMQFVKFDNFDYIFKKDIYFMERLRDFFLNTLFSLPVILVFSLMIAMLINQKIRFKGVFRTLFFLPIIVVSGPVMQMLISEGATTMPMIEQYGVYTIIAQFAPWFLIEPITNLFRQLILILWYSGVPILIFLAGLQKIDRGVYEAALIDGAGAWIAFWKITLPAIRGMILINAVYTIVFLACGENNPVIILIRENMMNPNVGYGVAAAMAWVYSIGITLALGLAFILVGREPKDKVKHAGVFLNRRA